MQNETIRQKFLVEVMPELHHTGEEEEWEKTAGGMQRQQGGMALCPTLCTTHGTSATDTAAQGSNMDGEFLPECEELQ